MEKLIKVNKLDDNMKTSIKVRVRTGVLMALFGAVLLALFAFSDASIGSSIQNGWVWWIGENVHKYISFTCAVIAIGLISWISYFIARELDNCFLKTQNKKIVATIGTGLILIQLIPTIIWLLPNYFFSDLSSSAEFLGLKISWWWTIGFFASGVLLIIIFVPIFIHLMKYSKSPTKINKIMFPIVTIVIAVAFGSIYYLSIVRYWTTIFLLLLAVCGCDIMAFFWGILFGKHKMAPIISPKKSWEGAIGGGVFGAALILLFVFLLGLFNHTVDPITSTNVAIQFFGIQFLGIGNWFWGTSSEWGWWLLVTGVAIVLVISTIVGDLFFSWLKRKNNVKDFSNILPGHGGILDRMDAFIFVVVTFGAIMLCVSIITAIYNDNPITIFPNFHT